MTCVQRHEFNSQHFVSTQALLGVVLQATKYCCMVCGGAGGHFKNFFGCPDDLQNHLDPSNSLCSHIKLPDQVSQRGLGVNSGCPVYYFGIPPITQGQELLRRALIVRREVTQSRCPVAGPQILCLTDNTSLMTTPLPSLQTDDTQLRERESTP